MLPFRTMVMVVAAVGSLSFFATAPLLAAPRVALVIGNASYAHAPALANPLNDAADMGAALERLGFAVTRLENVGDGEMRRGLNEFRRAASASEVAVVFYAGHGIEVDGRNFLVPVDARLASDQDVEYEAIPLELASRAVERASGLRLVILDACRENPFAVSMQRAGATRSIGRGLARVEPSGETLVAYAAKEGTVASDGDGRNSPYSEALLRFLEEPNLEVMFMLRKVRDAVLASTGGSQEPFWYGSLSSKGVYLAAGPEPEPSPVAQPAIAEAPRVTATNHREDRYWDSVKDSPDPADLEAYLERYPSGTYETLARNRLKRLQDKSADAEPSALDDASTSASDGVSVSARLEAERLAAEREFWASVKGSDDPADIRAYLEQYPDGTYEVLARNRLKRIEDAAKPQAAQVTVAPAVSTQEAAPAPLSSPESVEEALGLTRTQRVLVQRGLTALGFDVGVADGILGARTRAGIDKWQSSLGEVATGHLDAGAAETLLKAGEAVPPEPQEIVVQEATNTLPPAPQKIVVQGAMDTLSEALSTARSITKPDSRARALRVVAEVQAKASDSHGAARSFTEALSATRSITEADDRASALSDIAEAQTKAGDSHGAARSFTEALSTARSITKPDSRARALRVVAEAQAKSGDSHGAARSFTEVLSTARSIGDDWNRAETLRVAILLQARAGDVTETLLSTARNIGGDSQRASALSYIAEAQARAGDITEALSTARSITRAYSRARALSDIAEAKAKAGDSHGASRSFTEALSAARSITEASTRARALSNIAEAQAKAGDITEALSIARSITEANSRAAALSAVAEAQAKAGDITEALSIARSITEANSRAAALSAVAEAQAKAGDSHGASRSFTAALSTARRIGDDWNRAETLINIAEAQAKAGDITEALSTARSITGAYRVWALSTLSTVAEAQAKAGDITEALSTARSITAVVHRVWALSAIAEAQLDGGRVQ